MHPSRQDKLRRLGAQPRECPLDVRARQIASGEAELVSLGRGALTHADWPARVLHGAALGEFAGTILSPIADLDNAERRQQALSMIADGSLVSASPRPAPHA